MPLILAMLCRDCFSRHFHEQVKLYGQQVIINLVDQKVRQQTHYVFIRVLTDTINFKIYYIMLFDILYL